MRVIVDGILFMADKKFVANDTKSCVQSAYLRRDRRSTDRIAKWSGIEIEKN